MSVRKPNRTKRSKNLHEQFTKAEMVVLHVAMLVVFLLEVCKFVVSEVQGFVK